MQSAVTRACGRYEGLDGWRAALLVMGVGTHAVTAPTGAYQWVAVATHAFRMEAFFGISGFLAAIALRRQPLGIWLRSRLMILGVPMLAAMFLLNPITTVLDRWAATVRTEHVIDLTDHLRPAFGHVWFLWVLIVCSVAVAVLAACIRHLPVRVRGAGVWIISVIPPQLRWPTLLASLYAALLATAWLEQSIRSIMHVFPNGSFQHKLLVATMESGTAALPGYAVLFFLGMATASLPNLRRAAIDFWPMHAILVLAGIMWTIVSYRAHGAGVFPYLYPSDTVQPTYVWANKVLIGLPATLLILRHGVSATCASTIMKRLARASYTIFICHILLIAVIMCALGPFWWGSISHYLVVVLLATAANYAIHVMLVERSAWAALLLNGRVEPMRISAGRRRVKIVEMAGPIPRVNRIGDFLRPTT